MNSVIEKEKKLSLALTKLKNLNLKNPDIKKNLENLSSQKNQLEIEKQELEEKYKNSLKRTVATSAIPIGIPGCPELAF